jgi:hypothetical protein
MMYLIAWVKVGIFEYQLSTMSSAHYRITMTGEMYSYQLQDLDCWLSAMVRVFGTARLVHIFE